MALPVSAGLRFEDMDFTVAVRYRLGLRVSTAALPTHCTRCKQFNIDVSGQHALRCGAQAFKVSRSRRHDRLRNIIASVLRRWGVSMEVEPAVDDTTADRGDLLANFEGSPAAVDVSVADALAYLSCQKSSPIGATQLRDRMKLRKYQERYQKRGVSFFPISLQSLGGLGQKTLDFLSFLRTRPQELRQSLVCALVKSEVSDLRRWTNSVLCGFVQTIGV